jgi:hypothetical protein
MRQWRQSRLDEFYGVPPQIPAEQPAPIPPDPPDRFMRNPPIGNRPARQGRQARLDEFFGAPPPARHLEIQPEDRPVPHPRDPPIRIRGDYGNMRDGTYQDLVRSLGATVQPYYEIPDGSIWFPGREYRTINITGHDFAPAGFIDFRVDLNGRDYRMFRSRVIRYGFDSDASARLWRSVP